jgi:hypothetical protein
MPMVTENGSAASALVSANALSSRCSALEKTLQA